MQMVPERVLQKLRFAPARLADLGALIKENRLGAEPDARHQLTQEFFFQLVGATEYLAQLVNERRSLKLRPEDVAVHKVAKKLDPSDLLLVPLKGLSADTRKTFPADPYSEEGLIYRTINYRNEVAHRNTNPFHFALHAGPNAFFYLDPPGSGPRPVHLPRGCGPLEHVLGGRPTVSPRSGNPRVAQYADKQARSRREHVSRIDRQLPWTPFGDIG